MLFSQSGQGGRIAAGDRLVKVGRRVFSFPALLGTFLAAGAFLSILVGLERVSTNLSPASQFWFQGDTWWHLAVGKQILAAHSWPKVDIYSFTMHGKPWVAYEWFGEVVMAAAWRIAGLQGLMVLLTVLAATVLILLFCFSYLRSRNLTSAFLACAVLLPLAQLSFALRPQLLGYVFLLLTLISLEKFRQGHPRALWVLPPIFLLWVNTHGTFAIGFAVLAIYLASGFLSFRVGGVCASRWTPAQFRQMGQAILLCALASVLTPYGPGMDLYYLRMKLLQPINLRVISEWQPFSLASFTGVVFMGVLLLFCGAVLTSRLKCQLADFILVILAAIGTLLHARFILLFVPVFAPFLAELLARWLPAVQKQREQILPNAMLMACIGIAMVFTFPSKSKLQSAVKLTVPVEATSFIGSTSNLGRMFTYYDWESYLMFDLGPTHRGFMDGRLDLYQGTGIFREYLAAISGKQGFWNLLQKYNIHSCLMPKGSPLTKILESSPQWKVVYHDSTSVIFVKKQEGASETR